MLQPISSAASTREVASATSVVPHFLKNSLPPPNVAVPSINTGTLRPEPPRVLYSMCITFVDAQLGTQRVDKLRLAANAEERPCIVCALLQYLEIVKDA